MSMKSLAMLFPLLLLAGTPVWGQHAPPIDADRIKAIRERLATYRTSLPPVEDRKPVPWHVLKQQAHEKFCQNHPEHCFGAWTVDCQRDAMFDTTECTASTYSGGLTLMRGERFNHLWIFVSHGHSMPGSSNYLRVDRGPVWTAHENGSFAPQVLAELRRGTKALARSTSWPEGYQEESTVDLQGVSEALDYMESRMRSTRTRR